MTDKKSTIHVIPVGTNLWTTVGTNKNFKKEFGDTAEAFKENDDKLLRPGDTLRIHSRTLIPDFLRACTSRGETQELERITNSANLGKAPAYSSSEIQTLSAVTGLTSNPYLPSDDAALLIASDYEEVLMAALWTALILTKSHKERIHYLDEPQIDLHNLPGQVTIVRIPKLDAKNERQFVESTKGLGILGRGLLDLAESSSNESRMDFEFILTGGYRATVPYLAAIGETLLGAGHAENVQASILHESTGDGRKEQSNPVRIPYPLRSLDYDSLRCELGLVMGSENPAYQNSGMTLSGYAYFLDRNTNNIIPTMAGRMLWEMVKFNPEQ